MPDGPRLYPKLTEPFMAGMRQLGSGGDNDVKIIRWYIAVRDEGVVAGSAGGVERCLLSTVLSRGGGFREPQLPA